MADREKLIALMREGRYKAENICNGNDDCQSCTIADHEGNCKAKFVADYLIANGVTFAKDNNLPYKRAKQTTDLTGKCGSCVYAEAVHNVFGGSDCYIKCTNRDRQFRANVAALRPRTTKPCKLYKPLPEPPKGE